MLRVVGRFGSGNAVVDRGIIELSVIDGPNGPRLVAFSGTNGGVATYAIDGTGTLGAITASTLSTSHGLRGETDMAFAWLGNISAILVGVSATGSLTGWVSNLTGAVGRTFTLALPEGFTGKMSIAAQSGPGDLLFVLAPTTGRIAVYDPAVATMVEVTVSGASLIGGSQIIQTTINGQRLLLAVDANGSALTVHRYDPATNRLTHVETLSAQDGLAVAHLSDLDVAQMGNQTFVIAAAAGTSSLTVMALSADGQLTLTDHVLDSRDTRFATVMAVDTITVAGHVFVVAGGGDDGVTLFRLLPDGTLQVLATLEDTLSTGLENVTAVEIIQIGNSLFIYVGSETEGGLTVLEWSLGTLGDVIDATGLGPTVTGTDGADIITSGGTGQVLIGGNGDDLLIANSTGTRLTGGAGRDAFILRDTALQTTVTDFQVGIDRLDLTGWSMLRSVAQLTVVQTSNGLSISFNGRSVTIQSIDGRPLTLADVLPDGIGISRISVATLTSSPEGGSTPGAGDGAVSPGTPIPPGDPSGTGTGGTGTGGTGTGTGGTGTGGTGTGGTGTGGTGTGFPSAPTERPRLADWTTDPAWANGSTVRLSLVGTANNDTLTGASGRDLLQGGGGNDLIYTGFGADTVYAGTGDDTIFAAGGNNEIWGGAGNDVIRARNGADYIGGGAGNDLIDGGGGNNIIWAGAGMDTVMGGSGADQIGGGPGNDALYGYGGDDLIFGGGDSDTIHAGSGNDTIWGGPGMDFITGGTGNDVIAPGGGLDYIWGDAGADAFLFYRNYGTNYILDFNASEGDRIQIARWMLENSGMSGAQIVQTFGRLTAEGAVLDFGAANTVIHIPGVTDLAALGDHVFVV